MVVPILLLAFLLVAPVKDTVWWDTPGGKVMEHRDQVAANCTLTLYNEDRSVTFDWGNPSRIRVTAMNASWRFADNQKMPVAMQLGAVWLSNHGGSVIIDAVGHGNTLEFSMDQAVDDLLAPADHIAVKVLGAEMSITLKHDKIGTLLSRVRNCRDAIGR